MTDKEKIKFWAKGRLFEIMNGIGENDAKNILADLLSLIDSMQEESKECMYSKDNYTDEDRKTLCDGCEEECIEKINEERKRDLSLWSLGDFENNFFEIIKPYKDSRNYKNLCIRLVVWRSELWRWIHWKKRKEEPVSDEFKIALEKKVREAQDWTYIEEEGGECPLNEEFGAYDLEEFAKWGANWQKEQLLAKAVDTTVHIDAGNYPYIPQMELYDYDKDIPLAKEGDKYKVILIKE